MALLDSTTSDKNILNPKDHQSLAKKSFQNRTNSLRVSEFLSNEKIQAK